MAKNEVEELKWQKWSWRSTKLPKKMDVLFVSGFLLLLSSSSSLLLLLFLNSFYLLKNTHNHLCVCVGGGGVQPCNLMQSVFKN